MDRFDLMKKRVASETAHDKPFPPGDCAVLVHEDAPWAIAEIEQLRQDVLTMLDACGQLCSAMDDATGSTEWSADHIATLDTVSEIDQRADKFRKQ